MNNIAYEGAVMENLLSEICTVLGIDFSELTTKIISSGNSEVLKSLISCCRTMQLAERQSA